MRDRRSLWGYLPLLLVLGMICGMAVIVTGQDNACTEAHGSLKWSWTSRTLAECVRDGVVIHP
jgi:hypothetical protein